jgi:hypothetical protein
VVYEIKKRRAQCTEHRAKPKSLEPCALSPEQISRKTEPFALNPEQILKTLSPVPYADEPASADLVLNVCPIFFYKVLYKMSLHGMGE